MRHGLRHDLRLENSEAWRARGRSYVWRVVGASPCDGSVGWGWRGAEGERAQGDENAGEEKLDAGVTGDLGCDGEAVMATGMEGEGGKRGSSRVLMPVR